MVSRQAEVRWAEIWAWARAGEEEGGAVRGELGKRGSEEEAEGAEGRES